MGLRNFIYLKKLNQGGMGEVHLAARHDPISNFSKLFCVKTVRTEKKNSKEIKEWFLDEARVVSRLSHRNIAQVVDFGLYDSQYYLVSEYCEGLNLSEIVKSLGRNKRGLSMPLVLFVISEILDGLAYAHGVRDRIENKAMGLVHRDLSPNNIMISFSGEVKIIDFGVARSSSLNKKKKTSAVGKTSYMSPEQASNKAVDRRSDLYTLGVMMWEMITFKKLFWAEDKAQLVSKVRRGIQGNLWKQVLVFDEQLNSIFRRCLAANPESRYDNAADFLTDLNKYIKSKSMFSSTIEMRQFINSNFNDEFNNHEEEISNLLKTHKFDLDNQDAIQINAESGRHFQAPVQTSITELRELKKVPSFDPNSGDSLDSSAHLSAIADEESITGSSFTFGNGADVTEAEMAGKGSFDSPNDLETLVPDKEVVLDRNVKKGKANPFDPSKAVDIGPELNLKSGLMMESEGDESDTFRPHNVVKSSGSASYDNLKLVDEQKTEKWKLSGDFDRNLKYGLVIGILVSVIGISYFFVGFNEVDGLILASKQCQETPFTEDCERKKIVVGDPKNWFHKKPTERSPSATQRKLNELNSESKDSN